MTRANTHPVGDLIVTALGVCMVITYTIIMYRHATMNPYSVWCDPHLVTCRAG